MTEILVEPRRSMVDEPLAIRVVGLAPGQQATLHSSLTDDLGRTWRARAAFVADARGEIDVASRPPVSGTYTDADPMGLIWSMTLRGDEPNQAPFFRREPTSSSIEF